MTTRFDQEDLFLVKFEVLMHHSTNKDDFAMRRLALLTGVQWREQRKPKGKAIEARNEA